MIRRLAGLLVVCGVGAAGPAEAQVLTLRTAIAESLERNPALRQATAEIDRLGAESAIAAAGRLPQITFVEGWQRSDQPVFAFSALLAARRFTAADLAIDRLNQPAGTALFTSRLTIAHVVFDGGRLRAERDAAGHAREAAVARRDGVAADIAADVTQVYGRLMIARAAERAAEAATTAATEDLARAERRRDTGLITDADVLTLSVQLALLRQQALQARGDALTAMAELNRLRAAAIDTPIDAEEPGVPAAESIDLPPLFAAAERSRAAIRRADAEVRVAEARAAHARRTWLPTVAAQAGYELNGLSIGDRAAAWAVGGELRWSLSVGGAERARIRATAAALEGARAAADAARAAAQVEVVAAVRQLETARARAVAGAEAVRQAGESLRIIRNRYEAGIAGLTDMLRAVSAELDADRQRISALVDSLVARAQLDRAIGQAPAPTGR